ncbi:winged helix-turn-helix transcriptional regulator [Caenimonas sedimenti]|uniref:Winged helix-turn-helix transcriptional regulator n=1 Tax=Caenimonas sedimenti TaxID=2596921 RepID=A0A562ZT97_9BURK|nr:winged helix-turn-helix domain-containing protein [Caenimonas sedimenti]TWO71586.1 winged helix-turn-helix transcriptional regulator [Caenimonas sedimenti]
MHAEPDLARIAATVGDPRRIQMLSLLMEGRALTAKELALGAGIEPATATSHLKRLLEDGLLESTAQGRHKYFRFATEHVAQLVESLMRVAPRRKAAPAATLEPVQQARYCYDHLAGSLGTGLFTLLLRKHWLEDDGVDPKQLVVTVRGAKALDNLGIDVASAKARRRQFACRCLDWSERRDHLGGALGSALAEHLQSQRWIERRKHSRVVTVTPAGRRELKSLGLALA